MVGQPVRKGSDPQSSQLRIHLHDDRTHPVTCRHHMRSLVHTAGQAESYPSEVSALQPPSRIHAEQAALIASCIIDPVDMFPQQPVQAG